MSSGIWWKRHINRLFQKRILGNMNLGNLSIIRSFPNISKAHQI